MPPRPLALTPDLVARVAREMPDPGPQSGKTPITDAEREAAAAALLADKGPGAFWIFAYGSLIWKPAFEFTATQRCVVHGWRRSFCLELRRWRGSPDQPGLMLALDRGGCCAGVAYRMPDDDAPGRMLRLLQREVGYRENLPHVRWVSARAGTERIRALAFYCMDRSDLQYCCLPVETQAQWLACAVGHGGSGAEYLYNTVSHLEEMGIRDRYLWALQGMVAARIAEAATPGPAAGPA